LYARYVPRSVFGDYKYIFSVFGMFAFLALPGMGSSLTRSVARGFDGSYRKAFWIIWKASFLITIAGLAVAIFFLARSNYHLAFLFAITAILMPLVEGTGSWKGFFDAKKDFKSKAIFLTIQDILVFFFVIFTILLIHTFSISATLKVLLIIVAIIGGQATINLPIVRSILKKISARALEDPPMVSYGLHLTMATIPSAIANYIDSVLIYAYLGPVSLAIYSFAIIPTNQLKDLLAIAASLAFPKFSNQSPEHAKHKLPKKLLRASIFTLWIIFLYIVCAPWLFKIFFPLYTDSVVYAQVFSLSLALFPLALLGTAIEAEGSIKKMYIYKTTSPLIQIVALGALIPFFGIWGAIIGKMLGRIVNQLFLFFYYRY
jgi:O-antigen/teichoic acid export membrane protein